MNTNISKNTSELWNNIWRNSNDLENHIADIYEEKNSIRWQRIENRVLKKYGSFENLNVIELGAGVGTYSILMAKKGSKVTVLDYSENALAKARKLFDYYQLSAHYVRADVLLMPDNLLNSFDISMSFGLAEHFRNEERIKAIKTHFDVLRKDGVTFISVPNKFNPPYRFYKFIAEKTGRWVVGEEYPFSRKEIRRILEEINVGRYEFLGDSLLSSLQFIFMIPGIRKIFKSGSKIAKHMFMKRSTPLDAYFSYALVLCAIR